MAHPCIHCGSECYCCGDIDDVIVSTTPKRCEGCGCEGDIGMDELDDSWFEDDEDFEDKTQYTDDGGIIVSNEPTIIHYPCTKPHAEGEAG